MKTINITFKLSEDEILSFESWVRQQVEVIDFKILPNTEQLYEDNRTFRSLVKRVKIAQQLRDEFINYHNGINKSE